MESSQGHQLLLAIPGNQPTLFDYHIHTAICATSTFDGWWSAAYAYSNPARAAKEMLYALQSKIRCRWDAANAAHQTLREPEAQT